MKTIFLLLAITLSISIFAQPSISSLAPSSGPIGTTVIITGTNFNTIPTNNIVFFGATMATVSAGSTTSLTVTVPIGATYQPISFTDLTTGLTAYSAEPFIVTFCGSIIDASSFATKVDFTTGLNPWSVSIGDIDGDGKSDLISVNYSSNTLSVFRNTSTPGTVSFDAKVDFVTGVNPFHVSIGDIDGDGKPDIAVANRTSNTVSVFRNTSTIGVISLDTKIDFAAEISPERLSIGDIDGDGKPDLAITNINTNTLSVFRNTGSPGTISFATKIDFITGAESYGVSIGDLDGDGKPDLAVTNYDLNTLSVLRSTSTPGVISFDAKIDFSTGMEPFSLSMGDLDGDGKPDLVVGNDGYNAVSVFKNTSVPGTISFDSKVDFTTGGRSYDVTIGDLDGDGNIDIAVVNSFDNTVSVLRNTSIIGSISFANKVDFPTGTGPVSVSIGDIDSDGKPDLAVANLHSNYISVFRNQINCPPTITTFAPTSGEVGTSVTITGTNFNSTPANNIVFFGATMATVSAGSTTSLTVTVPVGATYQPISVTDLTTGLSAYSTEPFITNFPCGGIVDSTSFASKNDFPAEINPYTLSIGDIDGDGKPDLVVPNFSSATISIYRNIGTIGTISFAPKVDFPTGSQPLNVSIVDLDGDGKLDVAVANHGLNKVSVYRNTSIIGSISFDSKVDYTTGSWSWSVNASDLDGDGKPDLAITNYNSNTVSILRNTSVIGSISFATTINIYAGSGPMLFSITDFDEDGKPDLAIPNMTSNNVAIMKNTSIVGSISFGPIVYILAGGTPICASVGDLDGDNKKDLVIVNNTTNNISVLKNTSSIGLISFDSKVDFPTGLSPFGVSMEDLDGDGQIDLVVTNINSNTVSVFKNNSAVGTISFAPKVDYAAGTSPQQVKIGDLDGDGKGDLVTANNVSDDLSILRNTVFGLLPDTAGIISGTTTICQGQGSVTYTVPVIANATSYIWTLPSGVTGTSTTNTIIANYGNTAVSGDVTVKGTNVCGDGVSSILAIIVIEQTSSSISETVCDSYTAPDGQVYTTSGTKTAIIPNAAGCDSTITIALTVKQSTTNSISETVCDSYTAPDGQVYTISGTKTAIIPNAAGCDSTITIALTVEQSTTNSIIETVCDSYTAPDGQVYTTSGSKVAIIPNAAGCDSTITIALTVKQSTTNSISETVCYSYTAPDGQVYTTSGTKTAIIPNAAGCDSTITIDLTINQSSSNSINETACDSYIAPDGLVYNTSGIKTALIPNAVGCDSTITIDLTIKQSTTNSFSETVCDSYIAPDGLVYTTSGIKTAVIPNAVGCDSTITIDLTVNYTPVAPTISISENILHSDAPNGNQWHDQYESISGAINQDYTASVNGDYYVIVTLSGCSSDASNTINVNLTGIEIVDKNRIINTYPNPVSNELIIQIIGNNEKVDFEIINAIGQVVFKGDLVEKTTVHTSNFATGVYIVKLENGKTFEFKKIIKE